jgi:CHASE3 domain sensor protein
MSASPDDRHGTDLLVQEIKEEAGRLARHPLAEVKRLEQVADEGDSPAAMLVLILAVIGVMAVILAVVISVALVVYYRG